MGKKQFIRHLEFYGFPDQNKYFSDANCGDLSFIIDKLNELDLEKADKDTLEEFEETVNEEIDSLKDADEAFDDRLSSVESSITDINDSIDEINGDVDEIKGEISGISEDITALTENVNSVTNDVNELSGNLNTFKAYAENTYAKKDDVYTKDEVYNKDEIDEIISSGYSGYATIEWVEEQGYITVDEADIKYTKEEDFETAMSAITDNINLIEDAVETISDDIDTIKEDVEYISGAVSSNTSSITDLYDVKANKEDVQALNEEVSSITEDINSINDSISSITTDIESISDILNEHQQEIEDAISEIEVINNEITVISGLAESNKDSIYFISGAVDTISADVLTRAKQRDLDDIRIAFSGAIDDLEATKAENADLNYISGSVDTVNDKIDNEIVRATSAETELQNTVTAIETRVDDALTDFDSRLDDVESALTKEISDREQGDLAIIGNSGDSRTKDTVWGAKAYAEEIGRRALNSAYTYTDNAVSTFEAEIVNLSAATDQKITACASKDYVDGVINDTEVDLRSAIDNAIALEAAEREGDDNALGDRIEALEDEVHGSDGLTNTVASISTLLNKITEWDGEGVYPGTGNGILDDIYRELHNLIDTLYAKGILP